jgi:hypothetical protein
LWDLAKEGYVCLVFVGITRLISRRFVFQLISLAGLHSGAVATGMQFNIYAMSSLTD